jgi:hypothetical protein
MPAREISHRFVELFNKHQLTKRPVGSSNIALARAIGSHFKPGMLWLENQQHSASVCKSILINGPTIFGRSWPANDEGEIEWHKSPKGEDFENVKAFKVSYRSANNWDSDIRQLWELNRLVWLIPVAQNFANTKDLGSGAYLKKALASYLESDRPGYSIRWNSAIEIAVQALSLLAIEKIVGKQASTIFPNNYLDALGTRLRWLERLPSKYSSENNHRVAEIAAQIAIYSRLGIKRNLKQTCEIELSTLIINQFWADGFNKEQSFGYHLFTLDLIATTKVLVPELCLSDEAVQRLELANQVTQDIYSLCDFWPSANDSDEAQLLGAIESSEVPPFTLFSVAFGPPKATTAKTSILHLNHAGYFFAKKYVDGLPIVLMVDHGDMGLAPLYAHAHADTQSIWLWVDGKPVLIEAGTHTYHSSEETRRLLQGSLAHNSISIEGRSIVEPLGPFLWSKRNLPRSTKFEYSQEGNGLKIHLSCALPLRHLGSGSVIWSREIVFTGAELSVIDELLNNKHYAFDSHFIFDSSFEESSINDSHTRLESDSVIVDINNDGDAPLVQKFSYSPRYSHLSSGLKFNRRFKVANTSSKKTRMKIWMKS